MGGDPGATGQAWLLVAALIVSLLVSQVLGMAGYVVRHCADATLVEDIRQRQITCSPLRHPRTGVASRA